MEKIKTIDVIIVGAGPMGIATAIEVKRKGWSHLVLEKGTLVNSIYHFPKNMTFFSTSEKLEIGDVPFMSIHEKPTKDEALEYYRRVVEKWGIHVHTGEEVVNVEKQAGEFILKTSSDTYKAKKVVIATGFYDQPNLLHVPGEEFPKVSHYYQDAHPFIGKKVIVVGAANSATQTALELYYKGAEVTMVVRGGGIYEGVKYWIKPNIENRIKEGSIQAYFNTEIIEIYEKEVHLKTPEGEINIENDYVFAMTGYHPNYNFLKRIGINCETDPFHTPSHDENSHMTGIEGLYVAGVVCGGKNTSRYFIENSKDHAEAIVNHIEKKGL